MKCDMMYDMFMRKQSSFFEFIEGLVKVIANTIIENFIEQLKC